MFFCLKNLYKSMASFSETHIGPANYATCLFAGFLTRLTQDKSKVFMTVLNHITELLIFWSEHSTDAANFVSGSYSTKRFAA